uniref:Ig-like domain-containing protein n=1 Tax=Strigamia maritima TaxID=126957 RepID=T1JIV1_STRMM
MKVKDSLFYPVHLGERISKLGGNVLLRSVQMVDMGTYVCIVNNSVGVEKIETALFVTAALSVRIQPTIQTIDVGKIAQMTCVITGYPVTSITWIKNGRIIVFNERLKVKSKETFEIDVFQREDRGMYQCVARNNQMTAQGTSEIKLGDAIPLLEETFPSQLVAPGRDVLLKCVISGNPSPQISWTLDDDPLPKKNNLVLADYVSIHGEVTSQVNITSIKPEDGGEYRCSGKNTVGKTEHTARLNISGPPYIRPLSNVSVVAGRTAHIRCRVSGHPVESVFWKRGGSVLPINHRQKVYSNGSLFILNAQESMDAGLYTCFAQSPSGQVAQRKMHVYVLNAPMISPFSFADNLKEGMRAGVTCLITQGDFPIKIEWLKDNKPIGSHLAISIRNIDEYTSNLVITSIAPRHNGNYTCIATNAAASVQYTARLLVKGKSTFNFLLRKGKHMMQYSM